jgi:hypothetical protein
MEDTDLQHRVHDFYAGRGPEAKYLGTVVLREDVSKLADRLMAPHRLWREGNAEQKFTAELWTKRVENLLASTEDVAPESVSREWPHPYRNSLDSDYSWWFESGGLYLLNLGALVEIRYPNGGIKSKLRLPNFTPPNAYTEENAR